MRLGEFALREARAKGLTVIAVGKKRFVLGRHWIEFLERQSSTALIDSREQLPLCLDPLRVEPGTLATGDYSVKGLEHVVAIERKSAEDMLSCVGRERGRFDREIQRLLAYPVRAIVVESSW